MFELLNMNELHYVLAADLKLINIVIGISVILHCFENMRQWAAGRDRLNAEHVWFWPNRIWPNLTVQFISEAPNLAKLPRMINSEMLVCLIYRIYSISTHSRLKSRRLYFRGFDIRHLTSTIVIDFTANKLAQADLFWPFSNCTQYAHILICLLYTSPSPRD